MMAFKDFASRYGIKLDVLDKINDDVTDCVHLRIDRRTVVNEDPTDIISELTYILLKQKRHIKESYVDNICDQLVFVLARKKKDVLELEGSKNDS